MLWSLESQLLFIVMPRLDKEEFKLQYKDIKTTMGFLFYGTITSLLLKCDTKNSPGIIHPYLFCFLFLSLLALSVAQLILPPSC